MSKRSLADELQHQMAMVRMGASELEEISGLKRATIYYMLNGKTKKPKPETLARIARALASDPVDHERIDEDRLVKVYRALTEASGQSLDTFFKVVRSSEGEQQVDLEYQPVIEVPGIGHVHDAVGAERHRLMLAEEELTENLLNRVIAAREEFEKARHLVQDRLLLAEKKLWRDPENEALQAVIGELTEILDGLLDIRPLPTPPRSRIQDQLSLPITFDGRDPLDLEGNIALGASKDYIAAWHRHADLVEMLDEYTQAMQIADPQQYARRLEEVQAAFLRLLELTPKTTPEESH